MHRSLFLILLAATLTAAQEVPKEVSGKNSLAQAILRNAVVPGWGHLYNGRNSSAFFYSLFGVYYGSKILEDLNPVDTAYDPSFSNPDLVRSERIEEEKLRKISLKENVLKFGMVYSLSMIDLISGYSKDFRIEPPDAGTAFRLSMVCPGLGQFYNHQEYKGVFFLMLESFYMYKYFQMDWYMKTRSAAIDADDIAYPNEIDKENAKGDLKVERNKHLWWGAMFYLLNLGDAYVSAQMQKFDSSREISLNLIPEQSGVGVALQWRFQ